MGINDRYETTLVPEIPDSGNLMRQGRLYGKVGPGGAGKLFPMPLE